MNIFDMKPRSGYRREESEDKGKKNSEVEENFESSRIFHWQ